MFLFRIPDEYTLYVIHTRIDILSITVICASEKSSPYMNEEVSDYPERGMLHRFLSASFCDGADVQHDVPANMGVFAGFALLGMLAVAHSSVVSLFVPDGGYDFLACGVGVLLPLFGVVLWRCRR